MSEQLDALAREILALSKDDQRRVARILAALIDDPQSEPAEPVLATAEDEALNVDTWLTSIATNTPFERLQLIEDALTKVETDAAAMRLRAARKALLDQHPGAAVRESVSDMARTQPTAVAIGVIGIVLAILGIAAKVLHLAF
jgi:hypothetical protein